MSEVQQSTTEKPASFGSRLESAREALGLERKEAALQLRLKENVILMMENDRYPIDLHVTFIRGYIRSYGRLLRIPELEIKKALDQIKPKPPSPPPLIKPFKIDTAPMTSGNYFMQVLTYIIAFTLFGLVGVWWYTHSTLTQLIPDHQTTNSANNHPAATPIIPTGVKADETTVSEDNIPLIPLSTMEQENKVQKLIKVNPKNAKPISKSNLNKERLPAVPEISLYNDVEETELTSE